ncbi:penicillin-binding protein 1A [Crassaminicella indica]|uniref:PBP1A family penicillin-binding protein n=1 Tax=Crassaminicella indica TaxID=2855394 RepID=A0ABX8RB68_9CLOT|nr:PBP1A family penicillin-binding protein [Crassaminicella indica]QXM06304.1 PBP1A family penicillin-binding protein [Crassaminicella indica]
MSENNKQKTRSSNKKKKKKISIIRVLILIILLGIFIVGGALAGWVFAIIKSAEPIDASQIYTLLDENSFIYDDQGNLIEKVEGDGLRTIVKYDKIPKNLKDAFIAIEDQDFFNHTGINPKRIIKALWEDIKAGAPVQGASTITQQLVKNLYLSNEKSIERKIKEAYYAFQLEQQLTKEQILEAYLNTVYLGSGAKGVQAAAHTYFNKDISELDLAECALLAGITKNPSKYSPLKTLRKEDFDPNRHHMLDDSDEIYTIIYDERYKPRQQLVLKIMKNENMITEEEYQSAINEDLSTHLKPKRNQTSGISSFFTDKVKNDVIKALVKQLGKTEEEAKNMLYHQGLRIYSTMDLRIQKILEKEYEDNKNFPGLVARKDYHGNILSKNKKVLLYKYNNIINNQGQLIIPKEDYKYDQEGNLILFKGRRLNFTSLYENGKIIGVRISVKDAYKLNAAKEILMLKGGNVKIPSEYKTYDQYKNVIVSREFITSNPEFFTKDKNGNLLINKDHYYISDKGVVQPQSAMVIMDPYSGEIKALVGGREVHGRKLYNRATQPRQPGSSIKPLSIYTPAIDNGWTAATVVDDIPHYDSHGRMWPKNWYRGFKGLSTLRQGVEWSMNVLAVKIGEQIGVQTSIDYLKKFGITSIVEKGRSNDLNLSAVALGGMTKGISPLEMTAAYAALANEGIYIQPKSFTKVTDREGNVILENESYKNFVASPEAAFIVTDMMRTTVTNGTATRARLNNKNIQVAGKTGTTSDSYDAWFVGYTPYYVGAVWMGNDLHIELDKKATRGKLYLWKKVMDQVHEGLPAKSFKKPKNVISVAVDTKSGKLPTDLSRLDPRGTVRNEYFIKGTEPKEYDDVHVLLEIDTSTNKLATPYCPPSLVEKRVFVKRKIPYDPAKNNGIVPNDYKYEAPIEYCPNHNEFTNPPPIEFIPSPLQPEDNANENNDNIIIDSQN